MVVISSGIVKKLEKCRNSLEFHLILTGGYSLSLSIDLLWHLKFEQQLGEEILEPVIMVAWSIWYNRN